MAPPPEVLLQAVLGSLLGLAFLYVLIAAARRHLLREPGVVSILLGALLLAAGAAVGAYVGYASWAGTSHPEILASAGSAVLGATTAGAVFLLLGFRGLLPQLHDLRSDAEQLKADNSQLSKSAQQQAEHVWRSNETLQRVVEERDRLETTLHGFEERWRSLVENAPSVILSVDRQAKVMFSNRPSSEFALGSNFLRWVPPESVKLARAMLESVFATGEPGSFECAFAAPDQPKAWFALRAGPVRREGQVVQATIIATDITDWKRAEEDRAIAAERQREIDRLREVERYKTQLLDTTAHELSNPLSPIKTHLFLLARSAPAKLDDRERVSMQVVERNFQRIQMLVSDMRDLTRVQNGKLNLQRGTVDLGPLVLDAAQSFEEPAKAAGVRIEPVAPIGLLVEADGQRLMQVLFNLTKNAIQFTPTGGTVRIEAAVEHEQAVVRVRDTGKGMTPEQIAVLFQPFRQVHDPGEREGAPQERGTGLGLYISKGIVEAHGGRLWAESLGPGRGATFTLALPIQRTAEPLPSAPRAPATG